MLGVNRKHGTTWSAPADRGASIGPRSMLAQGEAALTGPGHRLLPPDPPAQPTRIAAVRAQPQPDQATFAAAWVAGRMCRWGR